LGHVLELCDAGGVVHGGLLPGGGVGVGVAACGEEQMVQ
jgi:hypothetical protein